MKYAARDVSPEEAERDALRLWEGRAEGSSAAVFRWGYLGTPDGPPRCFLLEADGAGTGSAPPKAVGMVTIWPRRLRVGGQSLSAALLGDFLVDKAHRTFFPALTLQRAVTAWARGRFDLVYGFPNDSAAPLMKKLGYVPMASFERHVLVLRHAPYLARRVRSTALARVIAAPIDAARRLAAPGISRGAPRGLAFEAARALDAGFDALSRARPFGDATATGERGAKFLAWRFLERPNQRASVHALRAKRTGEVRAYAVLHADGEVGYVRDAFGVDAAAIGEALRMVGGIARRRGCSSLSFSCAAPPELRDRLHGLGFRVRSDTRTMIGQLGAARAKTGEPPLDRWYATEADEDQ